MHNHMDNNMYNHMSNHVSNHGYIGNDWDRLLAEEFKEKYYLNLKRFLEDEYRRKPICPEKDKIFEAFRLTAYGNVKVVIIGQDPYHGKKQAHGLAFSVQKGIKIPPSLLNIFKELADDLNCYIPDNGYLVPWAKQGVLLLNTTLTVVGGVANSHRGIGWETFTDKIIQLLNIKNTPIVFLLWGNNAKNKSKYVTNKKHLVLQSVHPSPLSAYRGFFGCKHFSKTNEFLENNGLDKINWQVPNI